MALQYEFEAETIIEEGRTNHTALRVTKNWLKRTNLPHLPDELIVLFLLSCESNVIAAQTTIRAYFRIKSRASNIFRNLDFDSESLTTARKTITCCSMRGTTDRTLILLFRFNDTDYRNFVLADCLKLGFMLLDINQSCNPPDELIVILDMDGTTFMHFTCITIASLRNFIDYLQNGMPLKIKILHILNVNYVAEKILAIAKLFMKGELASVLQTHAKGLSMEVFHRKWVPASCLPKEYGGDLPSYEELHEKSVSDFRKMKHFFEAEDNLINCYNSDKQNTPEN